MKAQTSVKATGGCCEQKSSCGCGGGLSIAVDISVVVGICL